MLMARGVADLRVNARRFRLPARLTLPSVVMVAVTVLTGFTTRESVAGDGAQGRGSSFHPFLSGDGRYVAFESGVSHPPRAGRVHSATGVFVRDLRTGTTELASTATDGSPFREPCGAEGISADGRYVLFYRDPIGLFVRDRQASRTERVTDSSYFGVLSVDGRYVAFISDASDLVAGDTNGVMDIFVHDRRTGKTERVSVASDGTQGNSGSDSPSLSADGRYVAFESEASDLVAGSTNGRGGVFVHDRRTGKTERVSEGTYPCLSADGRYAAFVSGASDLVPGDTNGVNDIFVRDRRTGKMERVSVASDGTLADRGGFVPREGFLGSLSPALSADGRYVAFTSHATNLVPGDTNGATDIFVHDRWTRKTERVSVASDGAQANGSSSDRERPAISANGRYVAFTSYASNLVPSDTNGQGDVFVHDRRTGKTERVSLFRDESIVEAWHRGGFSSPVSLSVYPVDGSCWVTDPAAARVIHLAMSGETLWSGGDFRSPCSASVNSQDGSC